MLSKDKLDQQGKVDRPDDEWLLLVALCGEGNDVVAATELGKWMALGVSLQLYTATALSTVHHTCSIKTNAVMLSLRANLVSNRQHNNCGPQPELTLSAPELLSSFNPKLKVPNAERKALLGSRACSTAQHGPVQG